MPRLILSAFSEDTIAAPGDQQRDDIIVLVTDTNGAPVTGLGMPNFKVDAMIVGSGGTQVNIASVSAPGFYFIYVVPISAHAWQAGVYIFTIVTEESADKGQTFATCLMD